MLKSWGVGGWGGVGWVAHVILVSGQGPNSSFFFFGGTFTRLGGLFGQGLGLRLGPGLDNSMVWCFVHEIQDVPKLVHASTIVTSPDTHNYLHRYIDTILLYYFSTNSTYKFLFPEKESTIFHPIFSEVD